MHLMGHEDQCQYGFSLNYTDGVGRTDGEECERLWAEFNQAAGSTKQMGRGRRCDTLDDITSAWNWAKLTHLGKSFFYSNVQLLIPPELEPLHRGTALRSTSYKPST